MTRILSAVRGTVVRDGHAWFFDGWDGYTGPHIAGRGGIECDARAVGWRDHNRQH